MKKLFTILSISISSLAFAQTQITNGDFEAWENVGASNEEPTSWNSNKTGSSTAQLGSQTCYRETSGPHGGTYCVRVETKSVPIIGTVVNGNVTTGVVNAPTTTKSDGYIGTVNYSSSSDIRHMSFTGRPDSLVGYYKYTSGGAGEQGKVTAILHTGDYFDPETPTNYHADPTANKIARATYFTPTASASSWTRFSVPFNYVSSSTPTYIMINITSSANQTTTIAGSKLWIDDLSVIYNNTTSVKEADKINFKVYAFEKNIYVDLSNKNMQAVLTVMDLTGKVVLSSNLEKGKMNSIQLPTALNGGMYLYQVVGADAQKTGKIIVE